MEKENETPLNGHGQSVEEIPTLGYKTPPGTEESHQIDHELSQDSGNDLRKTNTPDRLKVPKAFKFPERYRSPTDSMMSPVSKGLLARNRKGAALLPPSLNQPKTKIQELVVQNVGLFQN